MDLGISAAAFGFGAGLFFVAYCLLEIPSNLMLHKFGARADEKEALIAKTSVAGELEHSIRGALRSAFSNGVLLSIAVIYFVTQLCVYGITFFMPSIVETFGVKGSLSIGAISGLPAVGALIGVLLYPRLSANMATPHCLSRSR